MSTKTNIRSLDPGFLKWASTAVVAGNWHPLTMFSHAIYYSLRGLNPAGYHLVNIIFHALNTFLVCLLAIRLFEIRRNEGGS